MLCSSVQSINSVRHETKPIEAKSNPQSRSYRPHPGIGISPVKTRCEPVLSEENIRLNEAIFVAILLPHFPPCRSLPWLVVGTEHFLGRPAQSTESGKQNAPRQGGTITDTDLVRAFLSGRNERTVKAYSQDLADFQPFMGASTVDEAAKVLLANGHGPANATALAYKAHLVERGLQSATVNRRWAALRSLVQLARIMGLVQPGVSS